MVAAAAGRAGWCANGCGLQARRRRAEPEGDVGRRRWCARRPPSGCARRGRLALAGRSGAWRAARTQMVDGGWQVRGRCGHVNKEVDAESGEHTPCPWWRRRGRDNLWAEKAHAIWARRGGGGTRPACLGAAAASGSTSRVPAAAVFPAGVAGHLKAAGGSWPVDLDLFALALLPATLPSCCRALCRRAPCLSAMASPADQKQALGAAPAPASPITPQLPPVKMYVARAVASPSPPI